MESPNGSPRSYINRTAQNVAYCTDVEGHWYYFCSFVELSKAIYFAESGDQRDARAAPTLVLKDDWHFVFGGDTCDKGPGSIRFISAMVAFKKAYPDRVHLLAGNREINKIRFTSELDQVHLDALTPDTPAAHWVKGAFAKKPWDYIAEEAAAKEGIPRESVTDALVRKHNTRPVRLRYHFKHDMGSDGEFEFRRQEMALMSNRDVSAVSDDEVADNYMESVQEGGFMREYMQVCDLAVLLGETLFVHGQIIGDQFLHAPGPQWVVTTVPDGSRDGCGWRIVEGLEDWIVAHNAWAEAQVQAWIAQPRWQVRPTKPKKEDWRLRGGADLIIYGTPDAPTPNLVYCRWLEQDCMPRQYPPELVEYLRKHQVVRVVVGHTPHGNCPTVIPHDGGVVCIMADTSFSNFRSNKFYAGDNRGDGVAEVAIQGKKCTIKGRTGMAEQSDGTHNFAKFSEVIDYRAPPGDGDIHVGAVQPPPAEGSGEKRWFVKAKIRSLVPSSTSRYLLCNVNGFQVAYQEVEEDWVANNFSNARELPLGIRSISLTSHGDDFGHGVGGYDGEVAKRIFRTMDRDRDGVVTVSELLAACTDSYVRHALAWSFPGLSLEQAFADLDTNQDGLVSLDEFRNAVCFGSPQLDGSRPGGSSGGSPLSPPPPSVSWLCENTPSPAEGTGLRRVAASPTAAAVLAPASGPPPEDTRPHSQVLQQAAQALLPATVAVRFGPQVLQQPAQALLPAAAQAPDVARGGSPKPHPPAAEPRPRFVYGQSRIAEPEDTAQLSALADRPDSFRRKCKIMCTVGPASCQPETLQKLVESGMDIARLPVSQGSHAAHAETIKNIRAVASQLPGRHTAILLDVAVPEFNTGFFRESVGKAHDKSVDLEQGQDLKLVTDFGFKGDHTCIAVSSQALPSVVQPGSMISVANGSLTLKVKECGDTWVMTEVLNSCRLGERKLCTLPGSKVDPKDVKELITLAIQQGVDFITAPSVQSAKDVELIREALGSRGRSIQIISRVARGEALSNIDAIIGASDGILIARSELGLEIPPVKVVLAQKLIVARCNLAGKPVVTATQVLESMIALPRPSPAETSDVANAVLDGTDCLMLSEETARGNFPAAAASALRRICEEAEAVVDTASLYLWTRLHTPEEAGALPPLESACSSAAKAALDTNSPLIVVLTETGGTARAVAKYRPRATVLAVSASETTVRQLMCSRGVSPMLMTSSAGTDAVIAKALGRAKRDGMVKAGDSVVAVHEQREDGAELSAMMKMVVVP